MPHFGFVEDIVLKLFRFFWKSCSLDRIFVLYVVVIVIMYQILQNEQEQKESFSH